MKKLKSILIIDDEPENIKTIIDCFNEINNEYLFYRTIDSVEGFELAKSKLPDLIITDWVMPKISGIELIKLLKDNSITKNIPIIMITCIKKSSEDLKYSFENGAIDFIRKPIDKLELRARVNSMLLLTDYYNQIINIKNRELTHTSMIIVQFSEFNLEIRKKIHELDMEFGTNNKLLSEKLNNLKNRLSNKAKKDVWIEIDNFYKQLHPDFFQKLAELYPELTPAEIKVCAFLRLNMNTKDIASILCQSIGTIKNLRYKIRKKLNLSEENLVNFLISI